MKVVLVVTMDVGEGGGEGRGEDCYLIKRECGLLGSGWVVTGYCWIPLFFLSLFSFFSSLASDPLYVSQERQQFHELFYETRNVSSMQCSTCISDYICALLYCVVCVLVSCVRFCWFEGKKRLHTLFYSLPLHSFAFLCSYYDLYKPNPQEREGEVVAKRSSSDCDSVGEELNEET